MGKVIIKQRLLFNVLGIALLLGISTVAWANCGPHHARINALLSCVGDSSDTIILVQERSRVRVFVDTLKKVNFIDWALPYPSVDFPWTCFEERKSLFINAYQRNVFYVYASYSVP
jgi:hypothetical protein